MHFHSLWKEKYPKCGIWSQTMCMQSCVVTEEYRYLSFRSQTWPTLSEKASLTHLNWPRCPENVLLLNTVFATPQPPWEFIVMVWLLLPYNMNYAEMTGTALVLFNVLSPAVLATLTGLLWALLTHCENEGSRLECSLFDVVAEETLD